MRDQIASVTAATTGLSAARFAAELSAAAGLSSARLRDQIASVTAAVTGASSARLAAELTAGNAFGFSRIDVLSVQRALGHEIARVTRAIEEPTSRPFTTGSTTPPAVTPGRRLRVVDVDAVLQGDSRVQARHVRRRDPDATWSHSRETSSSPDTDGDLIVPRPELVVPEPVLVVVGTEDELFLPTESLREAVSRPSVLALGWLNAFLWGADAYFTGQSPAVLGFSLLILGAAINFLVAFTVDRMRRRG